MILSQNAALTIFENRPALEQSSHLNMKLIIPMAGRGTRVRPHSHVTPKPLLNVRGKSMVARIVDTFGRVLPDPITEGVFILGPDFSEGIRDQLREICSKRDIKASFAVQHEALGTGHAVFAAEEHLSGNGVVVFADTLFDMDPLDDLSGADVIAWVKVVDDPSRFGVAVREGDRVVGFVEKPKELISNEALIGIYYIADLKELRTVLSSLISNDRKSHRGEYEITDAFDDMLKEGRIFRTSTVTEWLDCGTIPALKETTWRILEKEKDGVEGEVVNSTIIEPVYIGTGAKVKDSVVGPNASVESDATVSSSVIRNSIVFAHAKVDRCVLEESVIGQNASVSGQAGSANVGDHSTLNNI